MVFSYIHKLECYLAIKRNKTQMITDMNDPKTIVVDRRSHTPKTHVISLIRSIGKGIHKVRTLSFLEDSRNWLEAILKAPGVKLMFSLEVVATEVCAVARTHQTQDLSSRIYL